MFSLSACKKNPNLIFLFSGLTECKNRPRKYENTWPTMTAERAETEPRQVMPVV